MIKLFIYMHSGRFFNNVNIKLAYSDVNKFYFSFQPQIPAAIIHVRHEFAELFHKYNLSSDKHGRDFDPNSKGN